MKKIYQKLFTSIFFLCGCSTLGERGNSRQLSSNDSELNQTKCENHVENAEHRVFNSTILELAAYKGLDRGELFLEAYHRNMSLYTSSEQYKKCLKENKDELEKHPWLLNLDSEKD